MGEVGMKTIVLILLFTSGVFADKPSSVFHKVKVMSVYDGDTFSIELKNLNPLFGEKLSVRVKGVDTPEIKGGTVESKAKAVLARDFVRAQIAKSKRVDLSNCTRGKYFRIVCDVSIDGKDLGKQLLDGNYAKVYGE